MEPKDIENTKMVTDFVEGFRLEQDMQAWLSGQVGNGVVVVEKLKVSKLFQRGSCWVKMLQLDRTTELCSLESTDFTVKLYTISFDRNKVLVMH